MITESEHKPHLRLGKLDKSAVAQNGWETGHKINETKILYRSSQCHNRVLRESIEISLAGKNILNQEESLHISKTWLTALKFCS